MFKALGDILSTDVSQYFCYLVQIQQWLAWAASE